MCPFSSASVSPRSSPTGKQGSGKSAGLDGADWIRLPGTLGERVTAVVNQGMDENCFTF